MHEVLVNRLGGLSQPRKSVVRLTDCPDMTLDVYRGRKTTNQQQQQIKVTERFRNALECIDILRPNLIDYVNMAKFQEISWLECTHV